MKFLKYLQEEWIQKKFVNIKGIVKPYSFEIIKNPTLNDLLQLRKQYIKDFNEPDHLFRWIGIAKEKSFYIFSSNLVHDEVAHLLKIKKNDKWAFGFAFIDKNGKLKEYNSDYNWFENNNTFGFLKDYLFEEYILGHDFRDCGERARFPCGYTEIFKNPSSAEMREVAKLSKDFWPNKLRFIADLKRKNLFIFKAGIFHVDVSEKLREIGEIKHTGLCIWAVASVKGTKLHFEEADETGRFELFNNHNDSWTKKYFDEQLSLSCKRYWSWG